MKVSHTKKFNKEISLKHGLYVVSTPIGNLEDITLRALNTLKNSDYVLCEDTRNSIKLLNYYKIKNKLLRYYKFNEKNMTTKILGLLKEKKSISIISDAGTPTISDPGIILINKCIEEKINIYSIPGPSALTSALSVCGFNEKFIFIGFLPKKTSEIEHIINKISNLDYSIVIFIPARKINFLLELFKKYFNGRKIFIAKEMTKIYESYIREDIENIDVNIKLKGELTVILSQNKNLKKQSNELLDITKQEIKQMLKKYSHKDVVEFISKKENLSKKIVYNYCLKIKKN